VQFASQKVAGFCSGTLIAPNVIATAGHCVTSQLECSVTAVIFNATDETVASGLFPNNTVYFCDKQVPTNTCPCAIPRALASLA
jgi:secreted trypsin-like serine protease